MKRILCSDDYHSLTALGTTIVICQAMFEHFLLYYTNMEVENHSNKLPKVVVIKLCY